MTPPTARAPGAWDLTQVPAASPRLALLDTRPADAFNRGHWPGAGHVVAHDFRERRAELPPRETPVLVLHADVAQAERDALQLAALGYGDVSWWPRPLEDGPAGAEDTSPPARLWRPSPFLERVAHHLPAGRTLDLAAGSGRESVWLALRGHDVEAWDHAPEALDRARRLASAHAVSLRTRVVDLEARSVPDPGPHEVVMVFRFLHRPLWNWIASAVVPGGMLVYETYRKGQERFGRPRHPRFLLDTGELRRAFPGFEVLEYEEPETSGGPVLARMLARRPLG